MKKPWKRIKLPKKGPDKVDVVVIGGGIIGLATARALLKEHHIKLVVLEAEDHLAAHQTGHNSGVVHAGLYYKPGSLKAKNCVAGREALYEFCKENGVRYDRCGKLVVATDKEELKALDELERRGKANGLSGIKRLTRGEIREYETHVVGVAALHVPHTGIVDFTDVAKCYGRHVEERGGEIRTSARVTKVDQKHGPIIVQTEKGELEAGNIINCAGLQCDRVAATCGHKPGLRIIPFRGEYYELVEARRSLVRNLIYPVPDPRFPFLGVHFTRMIKGGVEAGPNAVLAFKREGYNRDDRSWKEMMGMATYSGFRHMAKKYWKMGLEERKRSRDKGLFVEALQKLVPDVREEDLKTGGAGVRAQAVEPDGTLVDDFRIIEAEKMIHVLNAPSPAATASLSIGETIAGMAARNFSLRS